MHKKVNREQDKLYFSHQQCLEKFKNLQNRLCQTQLW